jgi:malate dehydrogenase
MDKINEKVNELKQMFHGTNAEPKRVLVTGAAGQIGYSIVLQIAKGDVLGPNQPIVLVLYDIPMMKDSLEGVQMELLDCAVPLLKETVITTDEKEAFTNIDVAFLVGAMPRKEGMQRKDLLAANVGIFKAQGLALAKHSKPTVKVLVVGNPANTNAYICAKYAAPVIPAKNISAMTRLDHNRATAQIAVRSGVTVNSVRNVIIWGNHSATQFPDVTHARVMKDGKEIDAYTAVNDNAYLKGDFVTMIQKRGAAVIAKRKLSSAMSAAKAACDHVHDWCMGTPNGVHVSMVVQSDGSYNIPAGIFYSFPVTVNSSGEWSIVKGLNVDEFARGKMDETLKELTEEVSEAETACM